MALPAQAAGPMASPTQGAVGSFIDTILEAISQASDAETLRQRLCDEAVASAGCVCAFIASPNANVGWLKVDAAAGFQASQVLTLRFLAKEVPGDPWGWVARAWRNRERITTDDASAWPALRNNCSDAMGTVLPIPRRHGVTGVLVLWHRRPLDPMIHRLGPLLGVALDRMSLEVDRMANHQEIRQAEQKYRTVLDSMEDAYYEVDLRGKPVYHNAAFSRMLGYSAEEIRVQDNRVRQTREMAARVFKAFNEVYLTGTPKRNEQWEYLHKRGHRVKVEGSVQVVHDPIGRPVGFRGILRDVSERHRMEASLRESEARFRALTSVSSDWYWEQDENHRISRLENRHARANAYQRTLLGKRIWEVGMLLHGGESWETHRAKLDAHECFRDVVIEGRTPRGQVFYISVSGEPRFDADGVFQGYRGVTREVTAQKVAEANVQYMAMHDTLTGLANRAMFNQLLSMAIPAARRYERRFAVLYIDLDRFKLINDTLGHSAGDQLLKEASERFVGALRASDVVARVGGNEFVVLLQEVSDAEQAASVARKLLALTMKPFKLMGHECRVTASIGGSMFPEHGEDAFTLIKHADLAMYAAKDSGKNNYQLFSDSLSTHSMHRLTLETSLRRAMDLNEFSLHYQAKVDLKTRQISGVEALLRWRHPELGEVSPSTFIPIAEDTGLIVPIGKWVLRSACQQAVQWQNEGLPALNVAVNLSARQFNDLHFLDDLKSTLEETGMSPERLELEITEGMIMQNVPHAVALLTAVKSLGVRLAIDDFGMGYSSLGQLKTFPIDTLKVDRSFIRDLETNLEDKAITSAIIAMGKTLSLTVIAEGVETLEQERFLREQACDEMQGYYFSKPVAPDEFAVLYQASLNGAALAETPFVQA